MLVLTRKAAEFVRVSVDGKVLVAFCYAPMGRANGVGLRGVYMDETGLRTFELLLDGPVLLPGLPIGCETEISLVSTTMGHSKARLGIVAPANVRFLRDELEDDETDDEAEAA